MAMLLCHMQLIRPHTVKIKAKKKLTSKQKNESWQTIKGLTLRPTLTGLVTNEATTHQVSIYHFFHLKIKQGHSLVAIEDMAERLNTDHSSGVGPKFLKVREVLDKLIGFGYVISWNILYRS